MMKGERLKERSAYWTCLKSDIPLNILPVACGNEIATVRIELGVPSELFKEEVFHESQYSIQGRSISSISDGQGLRLGVEEVAEFYLRRDESKLWCKPGPKGKTELLRYWLLHIVLPRHLWLERHLKFFHGGAVGVGTKAITFLANSGEGKSTLVHHFLQQGHSFFTDDVLGFYRFKNSFLVVPGVPFIRPYRRLEDLGYLVENFAPKPLPLNTIYVLKPNDDIVSPMIIPLSITDAVWELTNQLGFLFNPRLKEDFYCMVDIASTLRVCRLLLPWNLSRLPEVYEEVIADIEENTKKEQKDYQAEELLFPNSKSSAMSYK